MTRLELTIKELNTHQDNMDKIMRDGSLEHGELVSKLRSELDRYYKTVLFDNHIELPEEQTAIYMDDEYKEALKFYIERDKSYGCEE